jgi:divalent metal cation (Fe/Co/Zn/Cd) transporter
MVLIGESLALLLLGIATRIRTFILSSASLLIVGTLRALFLSTPPSLALMLLGVMLVVIATALFLVRHKLRIAWTQWE